MKNIIFGLLLLTIFSSAQATPSTRAQIEELMTLTNADAMVESIYAQMDQMFTGMGKQLGVKPSEQVMFDNFMKRVAGAMREQMSWEKFKEPMIDLYLKTYTEKEIEDMLAFYRTETGQSVIRKMPSLMQQSMMLSQQMMQGFMPRIQALSAEFKQELSAHRETQSSGN